MNNDYDPRAIEILNSDELQQYSELTDESVHTFKPSALKILTNRATLRDFFSGHNIVQPDFFCHSEFNRISAWAVKRNKFPLVIKTMENHANCSDIFILRAFRELPVFFEQIAKKGEKIVIESFIKAKARIEITYYKQQRACVTQIGLGRSLKLSHRYRVFPIKLPSGIIKQIEPLENILASAISATETVPLRLSCCISQGKVIPVSLNCGFNRLEYFKTWGNQLAYEESDKLNKIMFYQPHRSQASHIDTNELRALLHNTLRRFYANAGLIILLSSNNPQEILEDSQKADTLIKPLEAENSQI